MSPWAQAFCARVSCACLAMGAMRGISQSADLAFQSHAISVHMTACMPIRFAEGITQGLRSPYGGRNHFGVTPATSPIVSLQCCNCLRISEGPHLKRFVCVW